MWRKGQARSRIFDLDPQGNPHPWTRHAFFRFSILILEPAPIQTLNMPRARTQFIMRNVSSVAHHPLRWSERHDYLHTTPKLNRATPSPRDLTFLVSFSAQATLLSIRSRHLKTTDDAAVRSLIFIQFRRYGNPETTRSSPTSFARTRPTTVRRSHPCPCISRSLVKV